MTELYTKETARGLRYWRGALSDDPCTVETASGTKPASLEVRSKTLPDPAKATKHLAKAIKSKLRDGYILSRSPDDVAIGEAVFRAEVKYQTGSAFFDVHPTRGLALIAQMGWYEPNKKGWLRLIEVPGRTRTLVEETVPGDRQATACGAIFHGEHHAIFGLNGVTWRVHIDSGEARPIASFRDHERSGHHAHHLYPRRDAAGERALFFDRDLVARVIGPDGETVFETQPADELEKVCTAAISPSGRLVAAFVHLNGTAFWRVRVWDVESGEVIHHWTSPVWMRRIEFAPDDRRLVARHSGGLLVFDLDGGAELHRLGDWSVSSWAWSPDNTELAVPNTDREVSILDAESLAALRTLDIPAGSGLARYGSGGRALYFGSRANRVTGYRVR